MTPSVLMSFASIDHLEVSDVLLQIRDTQDTQPRHRLASTLPGRQAAAEITGDAEAGANQQVDRFDGHCFRFAVNDYFQICRQSQKCTVGEVRTIELEV